MDEQTREFLTLKFENVHNDIENKFANMNNRLDTISDRVCRESELSKERVKVVDDKLQSSKKFVYWFVPLSIGIVTAAIRIFAS